MTTKDSKDQQKEIDTSRVISHLNHLFAEAIVKVDRPVSPYPSKGIGPRKTSNKTYEWQVEFAYMIDEISRGPKYIVPKIIADANALIEQIRQSKTSESAA